jgi:hypothetical protein
VPQAGQFFHHIDRVEPADSGWCCGSPDDQPLGLILKCALNSP